MSVYIRSTVKDYKATKKALEKMKKAPQKAVKSALNEVHRYGPGWVAKEIVKVYGIDKSEVTGGKIGTTKVGGVSIDKITFKYRGRRLTPVHFGMKPKKPTKSGKYTLSASVIKGSRKTLSQNKALTKPQRRNIGRNFHHAGTRNSPSSPWMLRSTGAKSADKTQYIPFQRRSQPGKPQVAMRTVSLPQMVSSERTNENITNMLQTKLDNRFAHYMGRMWK